jgi:glucose-6-phosphate 1-dehydrogenase
MSTIADTDLFTTSDTAIPVPVLEDSATLHPHVIVVFGATGDLARRKLLALMAMEPPSSLEPRSVSEEKSKVFGSMQPVDVSQVVRGRYEWYRSIPGVAEDVQTQTLSALECEIDH